MQSISAREYRIAPELRRCCWYVVVAVPLLVAVAVWVERYLGGGDLGYLFVRCVTLLVLPGTAACLLLRWRLRVDGDGVTRRILWFRDVWTWETLASGRVRKLHPVTLFDPERPWWRRELRLSFLSNDDRREAFAAINAHYRLPPPPDLPETLTVRYGFRRDARLSLSGIRLSHGARWHEYRWDEVEEVHIVRMDPLRRDFRSLLVVLPQQEIGLKLFTPTRGAPLRPGGGPRRRRSVSSCSSTCPRTGLRRPSRMNR